MDKLQERSKKFGLTKEETAVTTFGAGLLFYAMPVFGIAFGFFSLTGQQHQVELYSRLLFGMLTLFFIFVSWPTFRKIARGESLDD